LNPANVLTKDIILEAIQDLHAREQIVTRETIAEHTGLALSIIDDRLGYLVDNGLVLRVQRGVYVPAETHKPARAIACTLIPDGTKVLEVGNTVLVLTPREARMMGELLSGGAQQYAMVEMGHQFARQNAELSIELFTS
jgi:hypothetical protein